MTGISSKVAAQSMSVAVVGIMVWIASLFGLNVPPEIAVYMAVVVGFATGWRVPETALMLPAATKPKQVPTITRLDPVPFDPNNIQE